ncbi:heptaprenyl diphosphate synthase [Bifidobacterium bohemicum]|uniref:Polyprenyl synthetase n=1 Tax=Bifidobacterium bohemicum DSM 22767 TaxID=1437606 RepID=A0A086ZKD5_9BIFI|nr:polyprenyl synthetase family protein [Bifidobacterium bohemicum]KFI46985.1 polyprenyl synthetase [Bifidobacterium bohemicum DSM 22767]SCB86991.1 heptaprenyl diphosphate synthase [Bifidobacterium bohemicum]
MLIRLEKVLLRDMQRVVDGLLHEETDLTPYQREYHDLLANHGKMLRSSLLLLFSYAGGAGTEPTPQRVIDGAKAIELLHLATLVHDDVLDNAPIRRNKPTINTTRGNKTAIYLGDLILSRYMEVIAQISPNNAFMINQARTVGEIVSGDLLQESARHDTKADKGHYEQAIDGKTAALFRLACTTGLELSAAETGTDTPRSMLEQAKTFGTQLGQAFQIADDVTDFEVNRDAGKPKLEDIREGIYTLPVILALEADPGFESILDLGDPHRTLDYLEANPQYIQASKDEARRHAKAAKDALSEESCPTIDRTVRALIDKTVDKFASTI